VPSVRNKTVRKKVTTGQSGVTDEEKLRLISALYIVVFNQPASLIPQATELFHLLGDILEGKPFEELQLRTINLPTFLQAYEDLAHD
jgi:hypothetical protein